jgi:hypothetical protein
MHTQYAEDDERHGHLQRAARESAILHQLEHTIMRTAEQQLCDPARECVAVGRLRAGARRVRLDDGVDVRPERVVLHRIDLGR